jgi:DNA recombination protein RmuC
VAKRAGLLYDKFIGFLTNVEDIGKALEKATLAHQNAVGQLSTGNGHLIGQVEKLRKMGIQTKKELPASYANFEEQNNTKQEELGLVETEDERDDKLDRSA